ncbi:MAG: hypothetical protein IKA12_00090 [Clostridia bacterium]|nr:hypothetical protein [Clostridia bacterium]
MKLKDIIKLSAGLMGLEDVVSVLDGKSDETEYTTSVIDRLTVLANMVMNELSSTYIPLERTDEVKVVNKKISMTALQKRPIKIINVTDVSSKDLDFTYDHATIYVDSSNAKVTYNYVAENYKLTDDVGFTEQNISKVVLAYGTCAEYCLTQRRFEEAIMWHERFIDGVKQRIEPEEAPVYIAPKNVNMPARRWE